MLRPEPVQKEDYAVIVENVLDLDSDQPSEVHTSFDPDMLESCLGQVCDQNMKDTSAARDMIA